MTYVAHAPGRVNLIGEHLDYLGGRCLSLALEQRTTASVRLRDDGRVLVASDELRWEGEVGDLRPGAVDGWAAYVAGVLWALGVDRGLDIVVSSTLPTASGLSSSAALSCAVATAVDHALGLGRSRGDLAEAAYRAETEMVGAPTGRLDQLVSMVGRPGQAVLADFGEGRPSWSHLPFEPETDGVAVLVIDSRVPHDMRTGGYGRRRAEGEEAARALGLPVLAGVGDLPLSRLAGLSPLLRRRAGFVRAELDRVGRAVTQVRERRWAALGDLLVEGHQAARDDFEISCEELDLAVRSACDGGALGARMTGGGFGGCAVALVPVEAAGSVRSAVTEAFARRRLAPPGFLVGRASAGAGTGPAPAAR